MFLHIHVYDHPHRAKIKRSYYTQRLYTPHSRLIIFAMSVKPFSIAQVNAVPFNLFQLMLLHSSLTILNQPH
jgi:hypothetical protein